MAIESNVGKRADSTQERVNDGGYDADHRGYDADHRGYDADNRGYHADH